MQGFLECFITGLISHLILPTLLSWLTEARFSAGLSAALPPSVAIAEKFGENVVPEEGDSYNELHDCGIIYYPEHPYLLCVMTKSTESFETLSSLIQHISEFMYQKMDEEYGG